MATQEEIQKRLREREEAEKKNPLLKKDFGTLIADAIFYNGMIAGDFESREKHYQSYLSTVQEINRRITEYETRLSKLERKDVRY